MGRYLHTGHVKAYRPPKGAAPSSKKQAQTVNLSRDLARTAVTYRGKVGIWQELLLNKLVVIPRKSKALYREGWLLVRHCIAIIELDAKETLYLRVADSHISRRKLAYALSHRNKEAVRSPALIDDALI